MGNAASMPEVFEPSAEEIKAAREAVELLSQRDADLEIGVSLFEGKSHRPVKEVLSSDASRFLLALLRQVAQGHRIGLFDLEEELTTTEAAALLGVSRPTLVTLLKEGRITHRMVGSHRRVSRASLLAFRESRDAGSGPQRSRAERMAKVSDFLTEWSDAEERSSS